LQPAVPETSSKEVDLTITRDTHLLAEGATYNEVELIHIAGVTHLLAYGATYKEVELTKSSGVTHFVEEGATIFFFFARAPAVFLGGGQHFSLSSQKQIFFGGTVASSVLSLD
jgi:hypothetical protein